MIGDIDRLIVGGDAGLECKTASPYSADKWKDGKVPLHYVLQCLHYMIVTGKRQWYIAALIYGKEFIYRRIAYDENLAGQLINIERRFWENNVKKGVMPPPDGTEAYDEILREYFKTAREESAIDLVGFDEKLRRREEIISSIKELESKRKRIEQEVKLFMKDNELATSGSYRVTWGNVASMRLDTKRLKEEKPDVYEEYAKPSTTRRFEVKAA